MKLLLLLFFVVSLTECLAYSVDQSEVADYGYEDSVENDFGVSRISKYSTNPKIEDLTIKRFTKRIQEQLNDISADLDCHCHCKKKMVAFMTYLSEMADLGANQHVKFDKVTLNDGKAYNENLGVFRVPYDGVYSFTFVVAERNVREARVRLVVDGKIIAGAVAEGRHQYHDAMGGNTAIVNARKGQSIWVETTTESHIEGSDKYRYSTFSGHLLYFK